MEPQSIKCRSCSQYYNMSEIGISDKQYYLYNCPCCLEKNFAIKCIDCNHINLSLQESEFYPGRKFRCQNSNCSKILQYVSCPYQNCRKVNWYYGDYVMGAVNECVCCKNSFQDISCSHCGIENYFRGDENNYYNSGVDTTCRSCQKSFVHLICPHCQDAVYPKEGEYIAGIETSCEHCKRRFQQTTCCSCKTAKYYPQYNLKLGNKETCAKCHLIYKTTVCPQCSTSNSALVSIMPTLGTEATIQEVFSITCKKCAVPYEHIPCHSCNMPFYLPNNFRLGASNENCLFCKNKTIHLYNCDRCKKKHYQPTLSFDRCPEQHPEQRRLFFPSTSEVPNRTSLFSGSLLSSLPPTNSNSFSSLLGSRQTNLFSGLGQPSDNTIFNRLTSSTSPFASIGTSLTNRGLFSNLLSRSAPSNNRQLFSNLAPPKPDGTKVLAKSEDNKAEPGQKECKICMDNEVKVAFNPCGHMSCCISCSERIIKSTKKCPMCNTPTQSAIRIYIS